MENREKIIFISLVTGVFLFAIAVVLYFLGIGMWKITFCVGFGVILATFGFIECDAFSPSTQVSIRDDKEVLGAMSATRYNFVLKSYKLEVGFLRIDIDIDGVYDVQEVSEEHITPFMRIGKMITWKYDREKKQIRDCNGKILSNIASSSIGTRAGPNITESLLALISPVYAQTLNSSTNDLVQGLKSDNLRVKVESSQLLIKRGIESVRPVAQELQLPRNDDNTTLNLLYVLNGIITYNSDAVAEIKGQLTVDDITLIEQASRSSNLTLQKYAADLLKKLE